MKRKFITILMAICMTVVYMPSTAFAEGFNTDSDRLNNSEVVEDLDDEGFPKVYTEGDTAIPDEPSQSQVEVNDVTYVFIGWDKQSDTFTDTSILFTGTWQKVTT